MFEAGHVFACSVKQHREEQVTLATGCGGSYVGETGNFQQRLKQYMYDVGKKVSSNVVAEHAEETGHEID